VCNDNVVDFHAPFDSSPVILSQFSVGWCAVRHTKTPKPFSSSRKPEQHEKQICKYMYHIYIYMDDVLAYPCLVIRPHDCPEKDRINCTQGSGRATTCSGFIRNKSKTYDNSSKRNRNHVCHMFRLYFVCQIHTTNIHVYIYIYIFRVPGNRIDEEFVGVYYICDHYNIRAM